MIHRGSLDLLPSVITHTLAVRTTCTGISSLFNDFMSPIWHGSPQATEVSRCASDRNKGHPHANQCGFVAHKQRGHLKLWPSMVSCSKVTRRGKVPDDNWDGMTSVSIKIMT